MAEIVGFKTFNTEHDFICWQKEAEVRKILQVSPVVFSMSAGITAENQIDAGVQVGCFVLYMVQEDN